MSSAISTRNKPWRSRRKEHFGANDLWIACHALSQNATLVSHNVCEFELVQAREDGVESIPSVYRPLANRELHPIHSLVPKRSYTISHGKSLNPPGAPIRTSQE